MTTLTFTLIAAVLLAALAAALVAAVRWPRRSTLDAYDRAVQAADEYQRRAARIAGVALGDGRPLTPGERRAYDRSLGLRDMAMREAAAARGEREERRA
jgi:hypothetical protein